MVDREQRGSARNDATHRIQRQVIGKRAVFNDIGTGFSDHSGIGGEGRILLEDENGLFIRKGGDRLNDGEEESHCSCSERVFGSNRYQLVGNGGRGGAMDGAVVVRKDQSLWKRSVCDRENDRLSNNLAGNRKWTALGKNKRGLGVSKRGNRH